MSSGHISHVEAERSAIRARILDAKRFEEAEAELFRVAEVLRRLRTESQSEEAQTCFNGLLDGLADLRHDTALTTYANGTDL